MIDHTRPVADQTRAQQGATPSHGSGSTEGGDTGGRQPHVAAATVPKRSQLLIGCAEALADTGVKGLGDRGVDGPRDPTATMQPALAS
jgi:hypothetical protein